MSRLEFLESKEPSNLQLPPSMALIVPIQTLSWGRFIFVSLFARAEWKRQRLCLAQAYKEAMHTVFLSAFTMLQKGENASVELKCLVYMLRGCPGAFTLRHSLLLGLTHSSALRRSAASRYLPHLIKAISANKQRASQYEAFRSELLKMAGQTRLGESYEDAAKGA
jgi:hypothetical protein